MTAHLDDRRLKMLGQVAAWYYEDNLDQSEISRLIGKSRSMVSRLLDEARRLGLVEIRVRYPIRTNSDLEAELVDATSLSEASVLANDDLDYDTMTRWLGRLGAMSIQRRLHSDMGIVIGWGLSVHSVIAAMPEVGLENVMVYQAMGSVGDGNPDIDGSNLARTLAGKLGGDYRYLSSPLAVSSAEGARTLYADRTIATTLSLAATADVSILGIGAIDSEVSGLVRAGVFDAADSGRLHRTGIVGDVLGFLLDKDGQVADVPENSRVIALHPANTKDVGTMVGVAGGRSKALAIAASLRGGYFDTLVTDAPTARDVLDILEGSNG